MFDKFFVGLDLTSFSDNGAQRPISRVTLMVDDNNAITAGDDTGMELVADCPHATQAMVNAILAQVKGYKYQMMSADDTRLDPSAELGDGITAGGVYSVISRLSDDGSGFPGVTAPGEAELEDEYPAGGPMTQAFDRKIAETHSSITKTAEQITLMVTNEVAGLTSKIEQTTSSITAQITDTQNSLNSKIELTASSLTSEINNTKAGLTSKIEQTASSLESKISATNGQVSSISQTVNSITTRVTGLEGDYSSLEQYVDSMSLTVSNGSTTSTISLKAGGATISSQTINMTGLVTFTGLSNGTTTINGACIKTGYISANRLDLTGAITFSDLSSSVQNDINDAWSMAYNAQNTAWDASDVISGWTYRGTTYIDGSKLMTGTVMASELLGGSVGLLNSSQQMMGELSITGAVTSSSAIDLTAYGALRLVAERGEIFIESRQLLNTGTYLQLSSDAIIGDGNLVSNNGYNLGASYNKWNAVYATTGTIQTSDLTKKRDVEYGLDRYSAFFDKLKPISFLFEDGSRRHHGLGAQDVEQAMEECGISDMEFAGFIRSPKEDGDGFDYALRYAEFVPMCIDQIQKLKARVAELERSFL